MVKIRDDGIFDAPIDRIWKYINDNNAHLHNSFRIEKVVEQKGNAMTIDARVKDPKGNWVVDRMIMTLNPPKGFDLEYVSGAMKGTKHTHTYTPMGDRTKVVVEGNFLGKGVDDETLKKGVLAYFAETFAEDNAALKKYK